MLTLNNASASWPSGAYGHREVAVADLVYAQLNSFFFFFFQFASRALYNNNKE